MIVGYVARQIARGEDVSIEPPPTRSELRAWRVSQGLTQTQAGEVASVKRDAWARWEGGTRPIPWGLRDTLLLRWGSAP